MKTTHIKYGAKIHTTEIKVNGVPMKHYIHKRGCNGYCLSQFLTLTLDDMVCVGGEYWFSTLKDIDIAIAKENGK
jgi:hypothetical protein